MKASDVTACIVTKGDADLSPLLDSLIFPKHVIWDNSKRENHRVYGRFMAAQEAKTPLVFFQDDDVIVPAETQRQLLKAHKPGTLTANMPAEYRSTQYPDLAWLGFGSIADTDMPAKAFERWQRSRGSVGHSGFDYVGCDIVFSMLSKRTVIDGQIEVTERAFGDDRVYKIPSFRGWKQRYYERATLVARNGT